ncbi:MAG: T9SS type A sorting domain-containing protein [Calditrichaeota bacterium]|nr:T9SS type A sorting domain-containing protein [Calditrichota bacterium]
MKRLALTLCILGGMQLAAFASGRVLRPAEGNGLVSMPNMPRPAGADENDTLFHDYAQGGYSAIDIPNDAGDHYYNVRFSPPFHPFRLVGALAAFYAVGPNHNGDTIGTPNCRVIVYESGANENDEPGYPVDAIDSIYVPYEQLTFSPSWRQMIFNFIDLRSLGISYNDSIDFHLVFELVADENEGDLLSFFVDDGRFRESDRSGLWSGPDESWKKLIEISFGGPRRGFNFALRAIVANDSIQAVIEPGGRILPNNLLLTTAYPNPFNATTRLDYAVPFGIPFEIALYDPSGRRVHRFSLPATTSNGQLTVAADDLATGLYLVRLTTPSAVRWQSILFLR